MEFYNISLKTPKKVIISLDYKEAYNLFNDLQRLEECQSVITRNFTQKLDEFVNEDYYLFEEEQDFIK